MEHLIERVMCKPDKRAVDADALLAGCSADISAAVSEKVVRPRRIHEIKGKLHQIQAKPFLHDGCPKIRRYPPLHAKREIDPERYGLGFRHFVAPIVSPRTMCLETRSAKIVTGSTITVPVAMILPHGNSYPDMKLVAMTGAVCTFLRVRTSA